MAENKETDNKITGKAPQRKQVRRPADICNHSGFRVKSDRMHPPRFILLLTLLILSFDLV